LCLVPLTVEAGLGALHTHLCSLLAPDRIALRTLSKFRRVRLVLAVLPPRSLLLSERSLSLL
jgi:hypothetical protein